MRKFIVGLFIALSLVGCSSSPSLTSDKPIIGTQEFIDIARAVRPNDKSSDQEIISLGKSTCKVLDNKTDVSSIMNVYLDNDFSMSESKLMITASIVAFCPKHADIASSLDELYP